MTKYFLLTLIFTFVIHNANAQFSKKMKSLLIELDLETGNQRVILEEKRHFEAPNWSRDGKYLLINADGKLEKIGLNGEKMGMVSTGFANRCNNDHGFTFDGKQIILSHNDDSVGSGANSRIFMIPIEGGIPKLITPNFPSYWHGVSPDGEKLVYCAERNGDWDVYSIDIKTQIETRLTDANGLDDGPEYSYDGNWIYFNSHRTGRMHLYKMKPDGSDQTQLTFDSYDNWFPHPSPDNKKLVYISYINDQKGQHPFGQDVKLRLYEIESGKSKDLTPVFFGGQGSLNVHSWSPDGKKIAFVRYSQ